jgi:hypothetical protein
MKWNSSLKSLPEHKEEVLIMHDNLVSMATFDALGGKFVAKEGTEIDKSANILWASIVQQETT